MSLGELLDRAPGSRRLWRLANSRGYGPSAYAGELAAPTWLRLRRLLERIETVGISSTLMPCFQVAP
jgi:hypothetical protein